MPIEFDDISRVLLQLYRASTNSAHEEFQNIALHTIKQILPFDSCMWGSATYIPQQGLDVHTIHLHNQSIEMLQEYDAVKHLDTAATIAASQAVVCESFHCPTLFKAPQAHDYLAFQQRHAISNVLISAENRHDGFSQWISLFRAHADDHGEPHEVQLLRQLTPHLMQALQQNRLLHLQHMHPQLQQRSTMQHEALIADPSGVIYHASPGCQALFDTQWSMPRTLTRLPAPMLDWMLHHKRPYIGQHLAALHTVEKDLLFVRLRPSTPVDHLAPRQRAVAELAASGMNYKTIAKTLCIAPATARNHLQQVYEKLSIQNVVALTRALHAASW
ncbi:helix-turn-helix transcriptional regulator [Lampropedia puyangensis]|uniref:Helix-turn-helix transcriptional regulator n=1 Tax=Lampropedia puyangensis TaxID=1330072 RepID=A0A4S8EQP2_9BURK|nr:helix-turn-helix transcriptional regulator [Lampropedia puyangensis]THT96410.1 helix-turn-helix transcriptional regulator [Lampropedia puyangensis]